MHRDRPMYNILKVSDGLYDRSIAVTLVCLCRFKNEFCNRWKRDESKVISLSISVLKTIFSWYTKNTLLIGWVVWIFIKTYLFITFLSWSLIYITQHSMTNIAQFLDVQKSNLELNIPIILEKKRKRRRSDPVLWQNPLYQQKIRKPKDNTQTQPKTSITQRLRTDLGRSVGVTSHPTGVVKPVYGYPTFPLTAKAV